MNRKYKPLEELTITDNFIKMSKLIFAAFAAATYLEWSLGATKVFFIAVAVIFSMSLMFYREEFAYLCRQFRKKN